MAGRFSVNWDAKSAMCLRQLLLFLRTRTWNNNTITSKLQMGERPIYFPAALQLHSEEERYFRYPKMRTSMLSLDNPFLFFDHHNAHHRHTLSFLLLYVLWLHMAGEYPPIYLPNQFLTAYQCSLGAPDVYKHSLRRQCYHTKETHRCRNHNTAYVQLTTPHIQFPCTQADAYHS